MRTRSGRINLAAASGLLWLALAPAATLSAQQPAAPAPAAAGESGAKPAPEPPAKAPEPPPAAAKPASDPGASSSAAALDYLYNHKAQDGSAAKQAMDANRHAEDHAKAAEALGLGKQGNPQLQARFEQYLGTAEIPVARLNAYAAELERVMALLRQEQTFPAWKELFQLAPYEDIDAGVSRELANRVESVWNVGRAGDHVAIDNQRLQNDIRAANRNGDLMSKSVREDDLKMRRRENEGNHGPQKAPANNGGVPRVDGAGAGAADGGGAAPAPSTVGLEGRLQLTQEYLSSLEARAKIKVNEVKLQRLIDKAKTDFADFIGTLFKSHRYQHVIIAADFYRRLFNESDYPVAIANEVNTSMDTLRQVKYGVDVFRYKLARGEVAAATERLRDAFALSEAHPSILALERDKKEKVAAFTFNLGRLQNLIEARDFGTLETLLAETHLLASDFDTAKPLALVNGVKLEGKLRLGKARLLAQQGDLAKAMEEFQAAAETWPGNPDLQDKASAFFETQDVKNQSVTEFDRFFADANYRAIFEKQLALAPAIHGDAKREEQMKAALLKVRDAEVAAEKANTLMVAGDAIGAWETIEFASKDFADDKKLNKLRADLSSRSADFVSSINKARDAEARSDFGFSLSWFVNAQRQYPASRIANEAIERLTKQILNGQANKSVSL